MKGHSAYRVWQRFGNKDFKRMAPGLRVKQRTDTLIVIAIVGAGVMIGVFGGLALLQQLHPPLQLIGVCQPPAQIQQGGCYEQKTVIGSNGQPTTVSVPAGYVVYLNGTRYKG